MPTLEDQIDKISRDFASALGVVAATAKKEEEIRVAVERNLALIQRDLGITLSGKHEFTVASGRADSVYERVVIEYKNPYSPTARIGRSLETAGTKAVIAQIKSRLNDLEAEYGHQLTSLFGVGTDGKRFVFIRYLRGTWQSEEPVDVTPSSTQRFLWGLFNLGRKGKPFTPDYLSEDFGSESVVAREGIRSFYETLLRTTTDRTGVLFSEWRILFGEVCGYDVSNPTKKIRLLAETYGVPAKDLKPAQLLYALHTYYALFMKLLAAEVIAFSHKLSPPRQKMLHADTSAKLLGEVEDLEAGSIFRHLNISNFLEGDLFDWYVAEWSPPVEQTVRRMVAALDNYNPGTLSERPAVSRDLLKKLYHQLFPRSVRHDLGEYYTPDWLADVVLDEVKFRADPSERLLDPACGSGTFLIGAINRIRARFDENRATSPMREGNLCKLVLRNVVGFDLNPIAVMAARTNYLIAIRDLISYVDHVEIPIYLCDSVMTPLEYNDILAGKLGDARQLETAVGQFVIPTEVTSDQDTVARYFERMEFAIQNSYSFAEFSDLATEAGLPITQGLHDALFEKLAQLRKQKRNGIWARIIKNAFAPIFTTRFKYVVGNPPWVNWESLPEQYRIATAPLWQQYRLFPHRGYKAKLGGAKDDISILMTYAAHDKYLEPKGVLGFVITQSIFKTKGGGEGFRRFQYGEGSQAWYLAPVKVHDLSAFQSFEGATNRAAVMIAGKGKSPLKYPIPYTVWKKKRGVSISQDDLLDVVQTKTTRRSIHAVPVDEAQPHSPWITAPESVLPILKKMNGIGTLPSRKGVYCATNTVFWITDVTPSGKTQVLITNLADSGKRKVKRVTQAVEKEFVKPLVRGRDVSRWRWEASLHILLPQDPSDPAKAVEERELKVKFPKTFAYFHQFESELRDCALLAQFFDPDKDPFYSSYNVGPYTYKPYVVAWKEICPEIEAAVLHDSTAQPIADHKLVTVSFDNPDPAYFLCGILNSGPIRLFVRAYTAQTSISGHISQYVKLPEFNSSDSAHARIVALSKTAHELASTGSAKALEAIEKQIDGLAAKIWGLTPADMKALYDELETYRSDNEEGLADDEDE